MEARHKVFLGVLTCVIGIAYFFLSRPPAVTLELVPSATEFFAGNSLVFERILTSNSNVKGIVYYTVLDKQGKVLLEKTERVVFDGQNIASIKFPTKEISEGKYVVNTKFKHGKVETVKTFDFIVKEKKSLVDAVKSEEIAFEEPEIILACPQECDDLNTCTTDSCQEGKCIFTPVIPCCGNGNCEPTESLSCSQDCASKVETPDELLQKAQTVADPGLALSFCASITQQTQADRCAYMIALKFNNSQTCTAVSEERTRDSCFMEFALQNDFSVCDLVINSFQQRSCKSLENIRKQQV